MDENLKTLGLAGLILVGSILIVGMMVASFPAEGTWPSQWKTVSAGAGTLMGAALLLAAARMKH